MAHKPLKITYVTRPYYVLLVSDVLENIEEADKNDVTPFILLLLRILILPLLL